MGSFGPDYAGMSPLKSAIFSSDEFAPLPQKTNGGPSRELLTLGGWGFMVEDLDV